MLLIILVLSSQLHFTQQSPDYLSFTIIVFLGIKLRHVKIALLINISHSIGIKSHLSYIADVLHRNNIITIDTFGMKSQGFGMTMDNLMHEMRKMNDFIVGSAPCRIVHHLHFVLIQISCNDTHGIFLVNNGGFSWH